MPRHLIDQIHQLPTTTPIRHQPESELARLRSEVLLAREVSIESAVRWTCSSHDLSNGSLLDAVATEQFCRSRKHCRPVNSDVLTA